MPYRPTKSPPLCLADFSSFFISGLWILHSKWTLSTPRTGTKYSIYFISSSLRYLMLMLYTQQKTESVELFKLQLICQHRLCRWTSMVSPLHTILASSLTFSHTQWYYSKHIVYASLSPGWVHMLMFGRFFFPTRLYSLVYLFGILLSSAWLLLLQKKNPLWSSRYPLFYTSRYTQHPAFPPW